MLSKFSSIFESHAYANACKVVFRLKTIFETTPHICTIFANFSIPENFKENKKASINGFRSEVTCKNFALDIANQSQDLHVVFQLFAIFPRVNLPFSHTKSDI